MAGLPYVPDSHDTCDPSPGERGGLEEKIRDRLSTGAPLIVCRERVGHGVASRLAWKEPLEG